MRDFLARHSYILVWISALIIVGALAFAIIQLNEDYPPLPLPGSHSAPVPQGPFIPPTPSISFSIQKSNGTSSFYLQWQNLPNGTIALNIFRNRAGATSSWSLWKTLTLTPDELTNGHANLGLDPGFTDGYQYFVQAVGNGDDSSSTDGGLPPILWASTSSVPIITTPPPDDGGPGNGTGSGNPPPENPGTPSSSPSSPQSPSSTSPGQPGPSSPSSSNPTGGNNPPPPTGNPYYNPQIQITGYGNAPGDFWVTHVNQSIEIGWQNLPPDVDAITVGRSASSTGPWSTILNQQNPGTSGSYSLQIIDGSVDQPYYYEMTAFNGTTTVAGYGPAYLEPN